MSTRGLCHALLQICRRSEWLQIPQDIAENLLVNAQDCQQASGIALEV